METEFTIPATKDFVTENRQLFVVVTTMESDSEFVLIPVGLGSCNELPSADDEVMGIERCVGFIAELDSAFNDDRVQNWSRSNVNKQVHALWNVD